MLNITMALLNNFPLRYTGTCLIGLCYVHHHAQRTDINPFTGELKYYRTSADYCRYGKAIIGVVNEDAINGNKEARWTYIHQYEPYNKDVLFDMTKNDWEPITAIRLEDPDSTNPKYWSIGYSLYRHERPHAICNEADYPIWAQEVYTVKIPDIRPTIESQVPLDRFSQYKSFSKAGFIRLSNKGFPTCKDMALVVIVLNFNINLYKMDHPDLDIIYYIISNPKPINNINYTPSYKEVI